MEENKRPKLKRKKTPVPKVMDSQAIDVLFGNHNDAQSRIKRTYDEFQSFVKIYKTLMRNNLPHY